MASGDTAALEPQMNLTTGGEKSQLLGINKESKETTQELRNVPEQREALVTKLVEGVENAKRYWLDDFDQMKRNMFMVKWGRDERTPKNFYTVNICQRHVHSKTAALYAKNPSLEATPKKKMRYEVWDGDHDKIQQAALDIATAQTEGREPEPNSILLLKDYEQGRTEENSIAKVGETLEVLWNYYIGEVDPTFKAMLKKVIKRMLTNFVGYVRIDFQREVGENPDVISDIDDHRQKMRHIERLIKEASEGEKIQEGDAELEELRLSLKALEQQEEILLREGVTFDFPASESIIPDTNCTNLQGFVGANWVCQEHLMSMDKASEIYKIDLREAGANEFQKEYEGMDDWDSQESSDGADQVKFVRIYEIFHKVAGLVYTVTPGYNDFLTAPTAPNVTLQRFWNIFALAPNDIENNHSIFGTSDIELISPMQNEMNKSRQGLSEHRRAARPKLAYASGSLDEADIDLLENHPAYSVLPMKGLVAGQKIEDMLQPIRMDGVDPNLYVTNHILQDVELVTGQSEATLGGTNANVSATQSSISQAASTTTLSSHTDELDDFLTEIVRAFGEIALSELSMETVKRIAGRGAVWAELTSKQIQDEIELSIQGGSSGKPNSAAELGKLERVLPTIIQIPGFKPKKLGAFILDKLDSKMHIDDFFDEGLPSMVSMNQMSQPGTGDPATDPSMQGSAGAGKVPQAPGGSGSLAV